MPIYEYRCEKCGKKFEVRQKFVDEPLQTHEDCGGAVERLVSAPAFNFKGSGWYVNDYAKSRNSESNGGSGKNESASTEKKDSGSGSGKEAAPASSPSEKTSSSTSSSDAKPSSS